MGFMIGSPGFLGFWVFLGGLLGGLSAQGSLDAQVEQDSEATPAGSSRAKAWESRSARVNFAAIGQISQD